MKFAALLSYLLLGGSSYLYFISEGQQIFHVIFYRCLQVASIIAEYTLFQVMGGYVLSDDFPQPPRSVLLLADFIHAAPSATLTAYNVYAKWWLWLTREGGDKHVSLDLCYSAQLHFRPAFVRSLFRVWGHLVIILFDTCGYHRQDSYKSTLSWAGGKHSCCNLNPRVYYITFLISWSEMLVVPYIFRES